MGQEMLKDQCDWIDFKINILNASHMGGVWERQIRMVRNVLSMLLNQHGTQLYNEALKAFTVEAESIVSWSSSSRVSY